MSIMSGTQCMLSAFEENDTGCKDRDDEKLSGQRTCVNSAGQSFSFLVTTRQAAALSEETLCFYLFLAPMFLPSVRKAQFSALELYPDKSTGSSVAGYKDDFLMYQAVLMVNTHLSSVEPISQATYRTEKVNLHRYGSFQGEILKLILSGSW